MSSPDLTATTYIDKMLEGDYPDDWTSNWRLIQLLAEEDMEEIHPELEWNTLIYKAGIAIKANDARMSEPGNTPRIMKAQHSLTAIMKKSENDMSILALNDKLDNLDLDFIEGIQGSRELLLPDFIRLQKIIDDDGASDRFEGGLPDSVITRLEDLCEITAQQIMEMKVLPEETITAIKNDPWHWPDYLTTDDVVLLKDNKLKFSEENMANEIFDSFINAAVIGLHEFIGSGMRERKEKSHFQAVAQRISHEPSYLQE